MLIEVPIPQGSLWHTHSIWWIVRLYPIKNDLKEGGAGYKLLSVLYPPPLNRPLPNNKPAIVFEVLTWWRPLSVGHTAGMPLYVSATSTTPCASFTGLWSGLTRHTLTLISKRQHPFDHERLRVCGAHVLLARCTCPKILTDTSVSTWW